MQYNAGAELAPCYARTGAADESSPSAASLRSSFSDSEDDEDEEDEGMMISNKKRSWSPGTPAIEKVEYHWNTPTTTTASSSASSSTVTTPLTPPEEDEDGYFNDDGDDDDDMVGSELDAGEVWPDEMDSVCCLLLFRSHPPQISHSSFPLPSLCLPRTVTYRTISHSSTPGHTRGSGLLLPTLPRHTRTRPQTLSP